MITSYKDKWTEKVASGDTPKGFPAGLIRSAQRKLLMLNSAVDLNDLRSPPGNRLEALRGDRAGQYSIRINDQFRICFEWENRNAINVQIIDYH